MYETLLMIFSAEQYSRLMMRNTEKMINVNDDSPKINKIEKRKTNTSICETEKESVARLKKKVEQNMVEEKSAVQTNVKTDKKGQR